MSQALVLAEKKICARGTAKKFKDRMLLDKNEMKRIAPTIGRSWIIGNLIGILPGKAAWHPSLVSWAITLPVSSPGTKKSSDTEASKV